MRDNARTAEPAEIMPLVIEAPLDESKLAADRLFSAAHGLQQFSSDSKTSEETSANDKCSAGDAQRQGQNAEQSSDDKNKQGDKPADRLVQPMILEQEKVNKDGSLVKFDEQGRPQALYDKDRKLVHEFTYKDKSKIPVSIETANGTIFSEGELLKKNEDGSPQRLWTTTEPTTGAGYAFLDSSVKVNDDGSFTMRYKGGSDNFYKDINFSASGKDGPRIAHMTRPDGTEQFEDNKGIKHLKKDGVDTFTFNDGGKAKIIDGRLTEVSGHNESLGKRVFSHDAEGVVNGFKDSDGTTVKRSGPVDKEGYALWETKTGEKVRAKLDIHASGVDIKGPLGHCYDFGPQGDITVVKPVITSDDKGNHKVTYPDGWSREFAFTRGQTGPTEIILRNPAGQVQSNWKKVNEDTWRDSVSGKEAYSRDTWMSGTGEYSYLDKSGNRHVYQNDGKYRQISAAEIKKNNWTEYNGH